MRHVIINGHVYCIGGDSSLEGVGPCITVTMLFTPAALVQMMDMFPAGTPEESIRHALNFAGIRYVQQPKKPTLWQRIRRVLCLR